MALDELNNAQKNSVEAYISKQEKTTAQVVSTVDRAGMYLISSKALKELFPKYQFVRISVNYRTDPNAMISMPGGVLFTLPVATDGNIQPAFYSYGNYTQFGDFLHNERVKIDSEATASKVWAAFRATNIGVGNFQPPRRKGSSWILGFSESPFRDISSDERIREAYYYEVPIDSDGFALSGQFKCVILERQKIK